MAKIINLLPSQTKQQKFKHPLLKSGLTSYTAEELDLLAAGVKSDPALASDFIMAMRVCLKCVVGRFLYYLPFTSTFVDDMVSVGFETLTEATLNLPESNVANVITRRIEDRIKNFLNDNMGLSAPTLRQQKNLAKRGEEPICLKGTSDSYPEDSHPEDAGDEAIRDILDAYSQIQPDDEIDIFLMDQSNWGRGYQELADDLGVGVATVHRRKQRLYQKYLRLTR